jgi:hypothetical protein
LCINHPFLGSPILIHACMATGEGWLKSRTSRFSKRVRKVRICSCEKKGSSLGISPTIPAEGDPGDPPKTCLAVFSGLRKRQPPKKRANQRMAIILVTIFINHPRNQPRLGSF